MYMDTGKPNLLHAVKSAVRLLLGKAETKRYLYANKVVFMHVKLPFTIICHIFGVGQIGANSFVPILEVK